MASLYHRFGAFYSSSFSRRPWLTLAVANGTLGVIADGLAQTLDRREQPPPATTTTTNTTSTAQSWDFARSGRFLTFGVVMAPLLAEWNKFIEYRFPLRPAAGTPASLGKVSMVALAKRVAFDQVLFAPFGLVCFVGAMGAMEYMGSWEGIKGKFSDMYTSALISNWQVWPLIQMVNFSLVPLRFRVPFTSMCGIGWTLYLSMLAAARGPAERLVKGDKKEAQAST